MSAELGKLNLLRTTFDTSAVLTAIVGGRKGSSTVNKSDPDSLDAAAREAIDIARASAVDAANDIAAPQPAARSSSGPEAPDLDLMHDRLTELIRAAKEKHPKTGLQVILDFTRESCFIANSNGVDLADVRGAYHLSVMFASTDSGKVSSFNGTMAAMRDLDRDLLSEGLLDELLRQSGEQTSTHPLTSKFVGDVILMPHCIGDVIAFLTGSLRDRAIISGTSIYKDHLGTAVASPLFSLHCRPVSAEISDGHAFTADGYVAADSTIVDHGVLKSELLSQYGAKKTGRARAVNDGEAYVIDAGDTALADMVKSVKRGLLVARFSGGEPAGNGDFSGVAKNSYLIEDGEIKYPVSETMISGNFAELLKNIASVSRERVDFGFAILPWIKASGVTVSGK
jgi:PmbA protein